MDLQEIRSKLDQLKGQHSQIKKDLKQNKVILKKANKNLRKHEKAKEIIRIVGIKTQEQLQFHIADITSLALEAVFPDPYKLEIEFVQRRNKTECDIFFVRDGERIDPKTASGGGTVDVAAFALRIAAWSLKRPHSINTIILDEPLRFVSEDLMDKASQMLKEVSKKLGIQFIIITHNPILSNYADKVFEVKLKKGISVLKSYNNEHNY